MNRALIPDADMAEDSQGIETPGGQEASRGRRFLDDDVDDRPEKRRSTYTGHTDTKRKLHMYMIEYEHGTAPDSINQIYTYIYLLSNTTNLSQRDGRMGFFLQEEGLITAALW